MAAPLRLLLVEDSEDDAQLLVRRLTRGGFEVQPERVQTAGEFQAALDRQPWDIVIGDHSMPQFSGGAALALMRARGLDVPFIFVSGTISEAAAVAAMSEGASDYLAKDNLARLVPAIERELREAAERRARRESEATLRTLVEQAPLGIYRSTPAGTFLSANVALARILGYDSPADLLTLDMTRDVYADPAERQRLLDRDTYTDREYDEVEATWKRKDGRRITVQLSVRAVRSPSGAVEYYETFVRDVTNERQRLLDRDTYTDREYDEVEATWKRKDGRRVTVQLSVRAVRSATGAVEYYETFVRDVTDQRQLAQQLVQAQKMEAVGRLAGGVAHDFNNLLTVILSYSELLLEDRAPGDPEREDIEQIRKAAQGASALTRQLLAFSRQQVLEPKVLDINEVVAGTEKLLGRLLGADVKLTTLFATDLGQVKVDPGQLEQIVMNLAVNARDAMPEGGRLSIETANVEMDEDYVRGHAVAQPGRYVMLAVTDTGTGMDAETQARIFEPFFTTKEAGKGTGLGLATVYGIVKQSGGSIWVYSELGHGTSFKIYFPRLDAPVDRAAAAAPAAAGGTETVLVVEDQAAVRHITRRMLERHGYTVLEAPDGETALRIAEKHRGPVDLLLTDVVMPGLSGRQLATQLVALRPKMRVIYMSGYTDDAIMRHGILQLGVAYLQKPFTPELLAGKVRAVLDD